ncbi:M48 family metalloprotease [Bacteroidota bacterium]
MKYRTLITPIFLLSLILFSGCKKDEKSDSGVINFFSIEDDKQLGIEISQEIANNPNEFPILDMNQYATAYNYLYEYRDSILKTGEVGYANEFVWQFRIIHRDDVVNAFAVSGGYLYFYTGLIKFLDNGAQFAGVVAHEMAHAANRHTTNQLTKVYGLQVLLGLILGENPSAIAEIAAGLASGLASLAFSRSHEYNADEYAVRYTYNTQWDSRGVGGFFQKIEGGSTPPTFLSTHPSPEDRYDKILEMWNILGGKIGQENTAAYLQFKNSLP